jgi:glycosyltransferase involved in cell wall biosynthesis
MLSGQNIVCFSPDLSWNHLWRNRHQIMTRLARRNKVLFVEPTPYLRPVIQQTRQAGLKTLLHSTFHQPMPNLWVYRSANAWPISGKSPLSNITFALRKRQLRRTLARLGMERPILWIFRYDLGEMIGQLDEKLVIYHAVDEYSAYALTDDENAAAHRQRIREIERDILRRADLAFVTSATLLENKRPYNPNIYYVPNGVDYEHFAAQSQGLPADVADIPGPRIGYVGSINEKIDLNLLAAIARQRPDWQLLMVGPTLFKQPDAIAPLQALPNVHFLGRKQVTELPAYMQACDVCLMPYAHNAWTENINPLKLYEYLATGRPIVATDIPAVQDFQEVLHIADNEDAFIRAIEQALTESTPEAIARRQRIARQNTWEQRVETLSSIITGALDCQKA